MNTTFNGRLRPKKNEPTDWVNLTKLPNENLAFVYQRLSTHEQVKKSIYSIKQQDSLEELAIEDGYESTLTHEQRQALRESANYPGWYQNGQIIVEQRDLGVSGTKGREDRVGLTNLIHQVEAGLVESVYVVHISRLYRDQSLINAFALGELFKKHNVILVTPRMRLNLKDKMHMRMYRREAEDAAEELEWLSLRLHDTKNAKARIGYYAGEPLPAGYIVDERKELEDGQPNPAYHTYNKYEPHAEVVRIIFRQLIIPGMTPVRVVRYCSERGIVFQPFPTHLDTKVNRKSFKRSRCSPDGSWPVTVSRVRSIAQNPVYIGWKIWSGEVVSKSAYDPIIDETTFWTVQKQFTKKSNSAKKNRDPLPFGGLLYCGNHDVQRRMSYSNKKPARYSFYECCDHELRDYCTNVNALHLDGPIGEAVIMQISLPGLAEQVLNKLTGEYQQAKEQAASYRREMNRLETEVGNLRTNLAMGILSANQITWIDKQIQNRLDRIEELADLERQPVGAIGKPLPGQADIDLVQSFLSNLSKTWLSQPNGLKNTLLRLLLEKVVIFHDPATIRVKILWKVGLEQHILIHRPHEAGKKWSDSEMEILREYYATGSKDDIMDMLPNREWVAIRSKAHQMKLPKRANPSGGRKRRYTPEEDAVVRRFYAREISRDEARKLTGRSLDSLWGRGKVLGLTWQEPKLTWEWLDNGCGPESEHSF